MICRRCGKDNDAGNQFCGRCGLELVEITEEAIAAEGRPCYRHPKEITLLACGRCERPICTRCVIMGPAGPRCPECARQNVRVSARGVTHDFTAGLRRMFTGGPFSTYLYIVLAIMAFGLLRSCLSSPSVIVVEPESVPRNAEERAPVP